MINIIFLLQIAKEENQLLKKIAMAIFMIIVLLALALTTYATEFNTIVANIISNLNINGISIEDDVFSIEHNGKIYISEDVIEKNFGYIVDFDRINNAVNLDNPKISILYPVIDDIGNYLCDGDWGEFKGGCSWYCAGQIGDITASSELQGLTSYTYTAKNVHDFNLNTVWSEGAEGYGIGEYLEYTIPGNQNGLAITNLQIINGYVKSNKLWEENSRVRSLKMYINNEVSVILMLEDSKDVQVFDIGYIPLDQNKETKLRFEILDVYEGAKYDDTIITELEFDGIGDH